ncbi:MAG: hypothetical protein GY754_23165 [bacterium]|nr:hypothetical protein [bacterium]
MKRLLIFLALLITFSGCGSGFEGDGGNNPPVDNPAPWQGTLQFGTTADDYAVSSAVDSSGNIYIAGNTTGAFEGYSSLGSDDIFLAKFDSSGKKLWIKQYGSSGSDYSRNVLTDSSGNVYVTVYSNGSFNGYSNTGDYDIFLVKYNSQGEELWTSHIDSSTNDSPQEAAIDSEGNIYVTGYTDGDMDGADGSQTHSGAYDLFLVKFNSSGDVAWIRQKGTSDSEQALRITIDKAGSIYVTGLTNGDLAGPGSNLGYWDAFYIRYNELGTADTPVQFGTNSSEDTYGIAVDSSGNIYIIGDTLGVFSGNTSYGDRDVFLTKYDSGNSFCWIKQIGTAAYDHSTSIAIDSSDNIYFTGLLTDTMMTAYDFFILSYDSNGELRWGWDLGTPYNDVGNDVIVDSNNNIYLSGYTQSGIDGNSNAAGDNTADGFMMKFNSSGAIQ